MSRLYHFAERKLLACVCDMLERDGIRIAALVFDGTNIADKSQHGNQTILDNARDACDKIAPGINMIWAWKELDYVLRSSDKEPLIDVDGSLRELRVPDDYTPPRKYKKRKFHHHKFEEIQHGTSKQERGPSLNVSCVLSKSSCDLSPFQNIGFVSKNFKETPRFNIDMFKQSLTLDVNPISLEPQYYEIVDDPEANGFDGSSYVFDQKISTLVTSLLATVGNAKDCEMTRTYLLAVATALEKSDGCVRKLIHMPIMQRQNLQDDRFDLGENGNPAKQQKTSDAPFITELPALHVPHGDGQSVYEPNTDAASVLLSSRVLVSCVASLHGDEEGVDGDGEQITLSLGYDVFQSPMWRLEVCTADNSSVFDSGDQPAPQDLLRRVLCLWEWSEVDLKDQRRKHASKYVPPWQSAVLTLSNQRPIAQMSISLLLNQIGPTLRYEPMGASYWRWTSAHLWQQDSEPGVALKVAATQLCETAVHLVGRDTLYHRTRTDALERFPHLLKAKKRGEETGECNDDAGGEVAGGEKMDTGVSDTALKELTVGRPLSTSLSMFPPLVERALSVMKDFVKEHGFEESIQKTQAVAFQNGIQDMFHPHSFHQPTPADRVCGRMSYTIDPVPQNSAEMHALEEFIVERYSLFGFDRPTALREADKDAVMFTGNPAIMSEANLRVHAGPYDAHKDEFGSRCGKNLRLKMLKTIYEKKLNHKMNAGFLTMEMVPQTAYSLLDGIEHILGVWIDEAQNKKKNDETDVQSWNAGHVLKLATGSEAPSFTYRCEYGREKTVTLKLQAINISSNKFKIPDNPGIRSKLEVSPYPNLGFYTEEDVAKAKAHNPGAFLIDPRMLDVVSANPGKVARYFIERTKAIQLNSNAAHPRSQAIKEATAQLLEKCTVGTKQSGEYTADMAEEAVRYLASRRIQPCAGGDETQKQLMYADECAKHMAFNSFQIAKKGKENCFCKAKNAHDACSLRIEDFSSQLKVAAPKAFAYYQTKTGKVQALQRALNIDERVIPEKKIGGRKHRNVIFGYLLIKDSADGLDGRPLRLVEDANGVLDHSETNDEKPHSLDGLDEEIEYL